MKLFENHFSTKSLLVSPVEINVNVTFPANFTCSKSTIETLQKSMRKVQSV